MIPTMMKTSELKLADRVILSPGHQHEYDCATVEEITDDYVICLRPYIHTADFSCGRKVITYIGFEKVSLVISELREVLVIDRKELK